jgi:hypothetical protein
MLGLSKGIVREESLDTYSDLSHLSNDNNQKDNY